MNKIYNILEVANTHNGDYDYVISLIDEFKSLDSNFGMKFQPFHYDLIATQKFEWYGVYKKLYFSPDVWKKIIQYAAGTKDIWLDIFDSYSLQILSDNIELIKGIKFQSSVLKNKNVMNELKKIPINNIEGVLNISGYSLEDIDKIKKSIEDELNFKKIILQIGFQDYPTKLIDSGISKIPVINQHYSNSISFADHINAEDIDAIRLPVIAALLGATHIEKHIKHSSLKTEYDYYSSLNYLQYNEYITMLEQYINAANQSFVNEREQSYLFKTIQIPISSKKIDKGRPLDINNDISFKRSSKKGLDVEKINSLTKEFYILRKEVEEDTPFQLEDFKKANIAVIIAVRMKSSRLPKKAILKIGSLSSIELCIKNCLKFENVSHTIMATSNIDEDEQLINYTYDPSVVFHRGHPEDVIQRYLDVVDQLKIDVIIRLTGDCPYPSNEILQILLTSHFQTGADFTKAKIAAIGTNLEIINTAALKKVKKYFPLADYSEYMTYYFTNNANYFKINYVDLPPELIRDYRLTLDYKEDLEIFNKIEEYFIKEGKEYNIVDIFKFLDENPDIAGINSNGIIKYLTDENLIKTINEKTTIINS